MGARHIFFSRRAVREPAAARAYAAIRRRILDLTFEPGVALSEARLSQEFGLSRTPVREALKRLETDGLVDVVPQHGTFVSPIRREFVMDAQFARSALECAVIRLAAKRRSAVALRDLEANLRDQEEAAQTSDFAELYRLDEALHELFAAAAGRATVWSLVAAIKLHMDRARKLTLKPDHAPTIIAQHRAIVDAIRDGDADTAAEAMNRHLEFLVEHFDEFIRARPGYVVERQPADG